MQTQRTPASLKYLSQVAQADRASIPLLCQHGRHPTGRVLGVFVRRPLAREYTSALVDGARRPHEGATVRPPPGQVHALDINRDVMLAIRNIRFHYAQARCWRGNKPVLPDPPGGCAPSADACLALTRAPSRTWASTRAKPRSRQTVPSLCPSTA